MASVQAQPHAQPQAPVPAGARRSRSLRRLREAGVYAFLGLCGLFSLCTTVSIVVVLFVETAKFFQLPSVSFVEFITGLRWSPLLGEEKHFGIWPLLAGTAMISIIAMGLALPLGIITAIYLSEYAPARVRNVLKPVLEIIAGIPTVVLGFFALTVITPGLQMLYSGFGTYNAMSAGLAVGILSLPIVCSLSEDALRAVPMSLRHASYGLGATRFETSVRVVFPAALSGIVAAFLLAIARAIGETMVVALAAGSSPLQIHEKWTNALDVTGTTQPMTGYMVQIFLGDVSNYGVEYYSSYAVAFTLFFCTLVLTVVGHRVRVRYRQVYE